MTSTDIEAVSQLDMLAFMAYSLQRGNHGPAHPRTYRNILACLNLNPTGCFVAEKKDRLVGYIFTRILGSTGWIGTFGVHPDYQGQGVGRSLLAAAVEHLHGANCMTVGLETMSDSPYNVGFYSRFGFLPTYPTILLTKKTGSIAESSSFELLGRVENKQALAAITKISQAACSGLDYSPEASNAREYEWGETLLVGWPQPWAFAIVRTTPKREAQIATVANIVALVLRSKGAEGLVEVLQTVEFFIDDRGFEQVSLAVNTADGEALQQALCYGFCIREVMLRMVFNGKDLRPVGKVLSSWLM
jgi:GNAT superfamily N-acetyltransferase